MQEIYQTQLKKFFNHFDKKNINIICYLIISNFLFINKNILLKSQYKISKIVIYSSK